MLSLLKTKEQELNNLLSKLQTRQDQYRDIGKHSTELDLTVAATIGKLELLYELMDSLE